MLYVYVCLYGKFHYISVVCLNISKGYLFAQGKFAKAYNSEEYDS